MKLVPKFCLGLFACLALTLLAVSSVRAQDTSTQGSNNNPAAASSDSDTQSPTAAQPATQPSGVVGAEVPTATEQSPEVQANKQAECESMGMQAGHRHMTEGREMEMEGHETGALGAPMMQDQMAMMRMASHNPKMAGRLLEMRADMMRAVADVMTKYAKEMESGQWQSYQTSSANED
jgi:uncharacterized iron-regulated membrane protein